MIENFRFNDVKDCDGNFIGSIAKLRNIGN